MHSFQEVFASLLQTGHPDKTVICPLQCDAIGLQRIKDCVIALASEPTTGPSSTVASILLVSSSVERDVAYSYLCTLQDVSSFVQTERPRAGHLFLSSVQDNPSFPCEPSDGVSPARLFILDVGWGDITSLSALVTSRILESAASTAGQPAFLLMLSSQSISLDHLLHRGGRLRQNLQLAPPGLMHSVISCTTEGYEVSDVLMTAGPDSSFTERTGLSIAMNMIQGILQAPRSIEPLTVKVVVVMCRRRFERMFSGSLTLRHSNIPHRTIRPTMTMEEMDDIVRERVDGITIVHVDPAITVLPPMLDLGLIIMDTMVDGSWLYLKTFQSVAMEGVSRGMEERGCMTLLHGSPSIPVLLIRNQGPRVTLLPSWQHCIDSLCRFAMLEPLVGVSEALVHPPITAPDDVNIYIECLRRLDVLGLIPRGAIFGVVGQETAGIARFETTTSAVYLLRAAQAGDMPASRRRLLVRLAVVLSRDPSSLTRRHPIRGMPRDARPVSTQWLRQRGAIWSALFDTQLVARAPADLVRSASVCYTPEIAEAVHANARIRFWEAKLRLDGAPFDAEDLTPEDVAVAEDQLARCLRFHIAIFRSGTGTLVDLATNMVLTCQDKNPLATLRWRRDMTFLVYTHISETTNKTRVAMNLTVVSDRSAQDAVSRETPTGAVVDMERLRTRFASDHER